jgi:parallel beta-helix repeat protein
MRNKVPFLSLTLFWSLLLAVAALAASPTRADTSAATRYVAPDGNCGGHSPCYATPQAAVDAASTGDTILVAEGVYTGVSKRGSHTQIVYINKGITIRGGYTTAYSDPPDPAAHPATLNAQGQGIVIYVGYAQANVHTTLDGLRLAGGNATQAVSGVNTGGAVRVDSSSNHLITIRSCWVRGNAAAPGGAGGIAVDFARLELTNSVVMSNTGAGVILFSSSSPSLTGNTVASNTAGGVTILTARYGNGLAIQGNAFTGNAGNGLYLYTIDSDGGNDVISGNMFGGNNRGLLAKSVYTTLRIRDNTFHNNTNNSPHDYDAAGGGIRLELANAEVVDNTFTANYARTYGGGLSVGNADWARILVRGNRFLSNTADAGGAIALDGGGTADVLGNLITGNQARWGGGLIAGIGITATLRRNIVTGNQATRFGGGFECESCIAALDGNTITGNGAGIEGGGAWFTWNAPAVAPVVPLLTNNCIAGNSAPDGSGVMVSSSRVAMIHNTIARNTGGAGVHVKVTYLPAGAALTNTIVASHSVGIRVASGSASLEGTLWGAGAWANGSDWAGNVATGTHNLKGDPLFVNAAGGDCHISAGSPARDAGVEAGVRHDIDGEWRPNPVAGLPDIGADEYHLDDERIFMPLAVNAASGP